MYQNGRPRPEERRGMALPFGYMESSAAVEVQLSTVLWIFAAVGALLAVAAFWSVRPALRPAYA